MKTIIFPGYSPHNKEWAHWVKKELKLNHEILVYEWQHWTSGKDMFIREEKESALALIGNERANIIAKSVGTRVVMHIAPIAKDNFEKVILCGIPSKMGNEETKKLYQTGLKLLKPENTIVFQNEKDPFASYEMIKTFVASVTPRIEVVKKERSDHDYPYASEFQEFLSGE